MFTSSLRNPKCTRVFCLYCCLLAFRDGKNALITAIADYRNEIKCAPSKSDYLSFENAYPQDLTEKTKNSRSYNWSSL